MAALMRWPGGSAETLQPGLFSSEEFNTVSLLLSQKLIQRKGDAAGVAKISAHFQIDRVLDSRSHTCSHRGNSF